MANLTIKQQYDSMNQSILNSSLRSALEKSSSPSKRLRKRDNDPRAMIAVPKLSHKATQDDGRRQSLALRSANSDGMLYAPGTFQNGQINAPRRGAAEQNRRATILVPLGKVIRRPPALHRRPYRTTWAGACTKYVLPRAHLVLRRFHITVKSRALAHWMYIPGSTVTTIFHLLGHFAITSAQAAGTAIVRPSREL